MTSESTYATGDTGENESGKTLQSPGDRVKVKVAGAPLPSTIRVSKLERPTEVAWRGGVRGIFWAEHRFVLEPVGQPSDFNQQDRRRIHR